MATRIPKQIEMFFQNILDYVYFVPPESADSQFVYLIIWLLHVVAIVEPVFPCWFQHSFLVVRPPLAAAQPETEVEDPLGPTLV